MKDIFETAILCEDCNRKTAKDQIFKEGFRIRLWQCPNCNKRWYHPLDLEDYKNFQRLKNKQFNVKLRMVGNSYTVSIPREIINFESEMRQEMNDIISMMLEEPGKLSIFFDKKIRRFINEKE